MQPTPRAGPRQKPQYQGAALLTVGGTHTGRAYLGGVGGREGGKPR